MPTLQKKHLPRRLAKLLAMLLAQLAAPAMSEVKVEVQGVTEEISANIKAYLSFERYKNSDDLSMDFVERLQERCEREVRAAMRPFGYYEPRVNSTVRQDGADYQVLI